MSRWTFYTAPGTCALATHIALHEAGAEFDLVKLDIAAGQQQGPDYLRVNPKGRVPALATPQGVLTETPPCWPSWRRAFRRPDSRRWTIPSPSRACRNWPATWPRPPTSPTPTSAARALGRRSRRP